MITKLSDADRIKYFELSQQCLREDSDDAREALAYLKETRGLSDSVIAEFKFGYIAQRSTHDWSGRIIMPLLDPYGDIVVLTTRDFRTTDHEKMPHLHEVFEKKKYLYGFSAAKRHIMRTGKAIVVEGQFDTTVLHTFGFNMTVGLLGSALSFDHVCTLRRYCKEIYLLFDSDKAGDESRDRAMTMYREKCLFGFDLDFIPVRLPSPTDGKIDPDKFVRERGKSALILELKQAKMDAQFRM